MMNRAVYILIATMLLAMKVESSVIIADGNYEVGKQVTEGTYTIEVVSGTGYVWTDTTSIDSLIGAKEGYTKRISNVVLKNGDTLHVSGGIKSALSIRLIKK